MVDPAWPPHRRTGPPPGFMSRDASRRQRPSSTPRLARRHGPHPAVATPPRAAAARSPPQRARLCVALRSGVKPLTLQVRFTSAPSWPSVSTTSVWPCFAASNTGVQSKAPGSFGPGRVGRPACRPAAAALRGTRTRGACFERRRPGPASACDSDAGPRGAGADHRAGGPRRTSRGRALVVGLRPRRGPGVETQGLDCRPVLLDPRRDARCRTQRARAGSGLARARCVDNW